MPDFELDGDIAEALNGLPDEFSGFARRYQTEIRPVLRAREGEREQAARTAKMAYGGAGVVAVIGIALAFFVFSTPILAFAAAIAAFAVGAIGSSPMRRLSGEAKDLLVVPVAESFGLDFRVAAGTPASISEHRRIGLVPSYDRSSFEDLLSGTREGVQFEFFEAHLKERRTTSGKNGTRTKYVTVFNGQCMRFNFHKRFFGETLVTRDAGFFNKFGGRSGMDRARLEDPEFEKAFEVYTTDQVEARFLLTPDMMAALNELERTFKGKNLRCAFSGEEMFVAVEGGNLFEPGSMFTPLDRPERVRELLDDFHAVFNIIDTAGAGKRAEIQARGEPTDAPG